MSATRVGLAAVQLPEDIRARLDDLAHFIDGLNELIEARKGVLTSSSSPTVQHGARLVDFDRRSDPLVEFTIPSNDVVIAYNKKIHDYAGASRTVCDRLATELCKITVELAAVRQVLA